MDPYRARKGRVPQSSVIIETGTLNSGTCTKSRLITYPLDASSWIHRAMHVEERVEHHSPQCSLTQLNSMHAGIGTRKRLITYTLDSSSWIHGAMHDIVEEKV